MCSSSGASCSKDVEDLSEEETTDEEEDSEDDEQWNSEDAENDKLVSICVIVLLYCYEKSLIIIIIK